jgi:hypothetical protein
VARGICISNSDTDERYTLAWAQKKKSLSCKAKIFKKYRKSIRIIKNIAFKRGIFDINMKNVIIITNLI